MIGAACADFKHKCDASGGIAATAVDSPSEAACAVELQDGFDWSGGD
jgi:hypothetical protein